MIYTIGALVVIVFIALVFGEVIFIVVVFVNNVDVVPLCQLFIFDWLLSIKVHQMLLEPTVVDVVVLIFVVVVVDSVIVIVVVLAIVEYIRKRTFY